MIKALDIVVLTRKSAGHGLEAGDVGTVLHVYGELNVFEIGFVTAAGQTVAVLTITDTEIRPMWARETVHARQEPGV